jgi:hypothetical protein
MAGISGISLSAQNNCDDFFTSRKHYGMWMMFRFLNDKQIQCCSSGKGWTTMLDNLPEKEVRYVISNYSYVSPTDNIERVKRVFLMWAPASAKIKDKLTISMYNREAQRLLGTGAGFHVVMQGNDHSDIDQECVIDKIKTSSTVF